MISLMSQAICLLCKTQPLWLVYQDKVVQKQKEKEKKSDLYE